MILEHTNYDEPFPMAWLAETGHIDDEWAEKLLGNAGNLEET